MPRNGTFCSLGEAPVPCIVPLPAESPTASADAAESCRRGSLLASKIGRFIDLDERKFNFEGRRSSHTTKQRATTVSPIRSGVPPYRQKISDSWPGIASLKRPKIEAILPEHSVLGDADVPLPILLERCCLPDKVLRNGWNRFNAPTRVWHPQLK